jgi:hypothetical protein
MSICNQLDLKTLGSQPIMPENLLCHWTPSVCMPINQSGPLFSLNKAHSSYIIYFVDVNIFIRHFSTWFPKKVLKTPFNLKSYYTPLKSYMVP